MNAIVGVVMGSDSDLPIMEGAKEALKKMNINFEVQILSAHRTPDQIKIYAQEAQQKKFRVIIAGAGGAAHLPGMIASYSLLPVIGVPICTGKLNGLDALLSVAQMPKGVPVATVAVDNSFNAGLLAAQIIASSLFCTTKDDCIFAENIFENLKQFQKKQKEKVIKANKNI